MKQLVFFTECKVYMNKELLSCQDLKKAKKMSGYRVKIDENFLTEGFGNTYIFIINIKSYTLSFVLQFNTIGTFKKETPT